MFSVKQLATVLLGASCILSGKAFSQDSPHRSAAAESPTTVLPASDQTNSGNWILREDISDDFEGDEIDSSNWFVAGENGDYYIWKGRAPSQFAPHNVSVEDGKLKIRSQWEPDFQFVKDEGHEGNAYRTHEGKDIPVTTGGVVSNPMEIWLDSEVFVWLGLPFKEEPPAIFEIEYMRVWQKPQTNLLDRAFFGFEGPILFEENPRPLDLVPESSVENNYQKFWHFNDAAAKHWSIVRHETFASGTRSLRFTQEGELSADAVIVEAPEGSVKLTAGDYEFSARVWVDPKSTAQNIQISLVAPKVETLTIDLTTCANGEWLTLSQSFTKQQASLDKDRLKISIAKDNAPSGSNLVCLDDLSITRSLSTP